MMASLPLVLSQSSVFSILRRVLTFYLPQNVQGPWRRQASSPSSVPCSPSGARHHDQQSLFRDALPHARYLLFQTNDAASNRRSKVTLYPSHNIILAVHCTNLPPLRSITHTAPRVAGSRNPRTRPRSERNEVPHPFPGVVLAARFHITATNLRGNQYGEYYASNSEPLFTRRSC